LLTKVSFVATTRWGFATSVIALGLLAHHPLGPLPGFVGQVGKAGRFEMPGGDLQMLGPFLRRQFALRARTLRSLSLKTRSLGAGSLRTARTVLGSTGTVWTVPQLLQPAFGFAHRPFDRFDFLAGSLAFVQFPLAVPQFVEVSFDLLHLPFAHLLHTGIGAPVLRTVTGPAAVRPAVVGTTVVGTTILGTTIIGAPVLHPATFARPPFSGSTSFGPHVRPPGTTRTRSTTIRSTITRSTTIGATAAFTGAAIASARFLGTPFVRAATVLDELLFGGEFGFGPNPTRVGGGIIRQNTEQTNGQCEPQFPKHERSSGSAC